VKQFVMGMALVNEIYWQIFFGKSTQDIFGEFDGKDYDKEYFDRCKSTIRTYRYKITSTK
jgi:2-oxoglutarate dehydrogenase E1 component